MNPHLPSPPSRPRTGLLAAGLLLVPVILGAQPAKSPSGDEPIVLSAFQVSTNQDKGYRPGNSVSATRIDTPIKDLPFAVSAFTEQFIEDIGARELKDIARFAPSVTNNAREFNAGNSKFAVRGFDANPMRNGFPGTAYIDVATVQRVEIIKGPSTLLYGQIEAGGAINYVTKQPQLRRSATLNLQFGSYGYDRAHLDTNQPIVPGRVLARLNVVHEHDFEYYNFHHGHTRVIAPVVTWKIDDKTTLTLDYQWFERREKAQVFFLPQIQVPLNNRALYPSATGGVKFPYAYFGPPIDLGRPRFTVSDPNDFRDTDFNTVYVELHRKFSDRWNARAVFTYDKGYTETRQHGRGDVDMVIPAADLATLSPDPAVYLRDLLNIATLARYGDRTTLTRRITYQQVKGWNRYSQIEANGRYDFGGATWKPLFGYSYNNFDNFNFTNTLNTALAWKILDPSSWVESNTPNSAIPPGPRAKGGGYNHGVYTVQPFGLLDNRLQIVAGARWSKGFAEATSNAPSFTITKTTPQLGIGYKLRPDLMAYANYSESFQANNRLLRLHSNVATIPGKPYLGRGYEAGLKSDFLGGRLSATLAGFHIEQKNSIIVIAEIQPNGTTFGSDLQDGNQVENEGVELELVFSPSDHWQVYFAASYNNPRFAAVGPGSEYLLHTQPEYTAKEIANLWTRYSFAGPSLKGVWVGGGFYYTGSKTLSANNPYVYFPDRMVWDAVVGYDTHIGHTPVTTMLSWKNFTNEDDSPSSRTRGLPSRLIFSATTRF